MPPRTRSARLKIALFCGGHGSASSIRVLQRRVDVTLDLLLNAYDDGRSTGALRQLLPGLPAPSDFRKNIALLLEDAAWQPSRLGGLLERRIAIPADVAPAIAALDECGAAGAILAAHVRRFKAGAPPADLEDVAIGNLVIVGAWLAAGRDFNRAIADLAQALSLGAGVINVDTGESRHLVAMKEDGSILGTEAELVAPQSGSPVTDLFLLQNPLDRATRLALDDLDVRERRSRLSALQRDPVISTAAAAALAEADLVLYGPGTQSSSLLPSYCVRGVADAIATGNARARIMIVNLRHDHDIQGLTATQSVEQTLRRLGDPANERRTITHVLHDSRCVAAIPRGEPRGDVTWIDASLEDQAHLGCHDGDRVADLVLAALRDAG